MEDSTLVEESAGLGTATAMRTATAILTATTTGTPIMDYVKGRQDRPIATVTVIVMQQKSVTNIHSCSKTMGYVGFSTATGIKIATTMITATAIRSTHLAWAYGIMEFAFGEEEYEDQAVFPREDQDPLTLGLDTTAE
ncbi:uncharacterized protein LOC144885715 [Branchiostoma floridae x Branchiostoma japonicum]